MPSQDLQRLDIPKLLNHAKYLHTLGRVADAERIYREILSVDKNNLEATSLLANAAYQLGDPRRAKKLWQQCLDAKSPPWLYLRNLQNYIQVLLQEGKKKDASRLIGNKFPEWPPVRIPDASEKEMLLTLARMLLDLGHADAVVKLLKNVIIHLPNDPAFLYEIARAHKEKGDEQATWEMLRAADAAFQGKSHYTLLTDLFLCAKSLGKEEEAQTLVDRIAATCPIFSSPRAAEQKHNILVLSGLPKLSHTIQSDMQLHFNGNYPSQLADVLGKEFRFSSVFSSNPTARSLANKLPAPDLVINNFTNAELIRSRGDLAAESEFSDSFGVAVINHPRKAAETGRDRTAGLLADVPDILVPGTSRFSRADKTGNDLAEEVEAQFDYPFIFRRLVEQQGAGMIRVGNRATLMKALSSHDHANFFITSFVDSRGPTGFYRKLRAAIVDQEIFVVRVDYDTYWNVHGRKSDERVAFYQKNRHLLEEEDRICANPEIELGKTVIQSLEAIRDRIPLEIFGVDFDVDNDGRLVFYEANATMNLLSTAPPQVNHPRHAEERLVDAIRKYFHKLI